MSDSDDNAFASADEGDENSSQKTESKQVAEKQKKTDVEAAGVNKDSKTPQNAVPSKGKGKQQSRNKKGKNSSLAAQKENAAAKKQVARTSESQKSLDSGSSSHKKEVGSGDGKDTSNPVGHITTEVKGSTHEISVSSQKDSQSDENSSKDAEADVLKKTDEKNLEGQGDTKDTNSMKSPEEQKIAESDRDHHTPQQEKVLRQLEDSASGGWGWSNWGSSLLSAASNSVQTFTHQVGDGLSTIMDTVESSLGVPDPESVGEVYKIAQTVSSEAPESENVMNQTTEEKVITSEEELEAQVKDVKAQSKNEKAEDTGQNTSTQSVTPNEGSGWFASWGVGDLAKKVQDTGKSLAAKGQTLMTEGFDAVEHLAAGGIDVLENIGKKTYNTLAEHDPALRKTRQFLTPRGNKPNLSSTLREAKDQAEMKQKQDEANQEALKAHFGTLFDDYQGLAHLEALEILSNQSEKKVHSLLNSLANEDLKAIKPQLLKIKNAFELDENAEDTGDQDFASLVQRHLCELELGTVPDKLNTVHQMVQAWIQDFDSHDSSHMQSIKETHEKSIQALAELTAKGVEQFHKAGEMVLLDKDKDKDCTERAHSLARLTGVLCHEIGNLSNKFVACLNKLVEEEGSSEGVTSMVTNIYLEASNSSTYIQDAFLLLLPVLQHAALEQAILARSS
ncbi:protein fam114a2-like [Plakobranchus ocellatus]|uniref:Protein fam114a2-like n=1 Tax=Plakobranchus ocellatus TaxID=259542 RepID=A0AAV3YF21_9GAST|nr:protein fam114a2-like [Plakobranchus ocellatus]